MLNMCIFLDGLSIVLEPHSKKMFSCFPNMYRSACRQQLHGHNIELNKHETSFDPKKSICNKESLINGNHARLLNRTQYHEQWFSSDTNVYYFIGWLFCNQKSSLEFASMTDEMTRVHVRNISVSVYRPDRGKVYLCVVQIWPMIELLFKKLETRVNVFAYFTGAGFAYRNEKPTYALQSPDKRASLWFLLINLFLICAMKDNLSRRHCVDLI